ncbi:MAG: sigma-70 family RNA polymerase sigma factor [Acidobacteriota bacterium]
MLPPSTPSADSDDAAPAAPVTHLLHAWRAGDDDALDALTRAVYDELRRLARRHMRGERSGHLLQTTALVHEAYMRLIDVEIPWQDRGHFFAVAARMMRRVLVDHARKRQAAKRGGGEAALTLEEGRIALDRPNGVLELDDALKDLAKVDERKAQVVELRFFGGLTIEETASVLGIGHATVERDLRMAKAWLQRLLRGDAT